MSSVSNMISVAEYFSKAPEARRVFDRIARSSSISGWALVKEANMEPKDLQTLLEDLQSRNLVQADGPGLDAFFHLTDLGFRYGSLAS